MGLPVSEIKALPAVLWRMLTVWSDMMPWSLYVVVSVVKECGASKVAALI